MNTQELIQALSQDLYRAANGLHRGSLETAKVFNNEARKKIEEINTKTDNVYIKKLITLTKPFLSSDQKEDADHLLMYSSLFKNYIQTQPNI